MGFAQPATFLILPSTLSSTSTLKFLDPISSILPIIPLRHHQPSTTSVNPTNNLLPCSTTNHIPHAKQHQHQPTQSQTKPTATPTSAASSGTSATNQKIFHPQHHTHNHWRFKHRLRDQKAAKGLLSPSQPCRSRRSHYPDQMISHADSLLLPRHQSNLILAYRCHGRYSPQRQMRCNQNPH
jgi:hypothetical protein